MSISYKIYLSVLLKKVSIISFCTILLDLHIFLTEMCSDSQKIEKQWPKLHLLGIRKKDSILIEMSKYAIIMKK